MIISDAAPDAVPAVAQAAGADAAEAVQIDSEFSVSVAYHQSV